VLDSSKRDSSAIIISIKGTREVVF
jgi:hypothetical protein